jgi:hypothetical protein
MNLFKKFIPRWAEQRILSEYRVAIKNVEHWRREVNAKYMENHCKNPTQSCCKCIHMS